MRGYSLLLFVLFALIPAGSSACPRVLGYKDLNCDGKFTVLFIGDSVVYGTGDIGDKGGYVRRLQSRLPDITRQKIGMRGVSTSELLANLQGWIKPRGHLTAEARSIIAADYIVLDVGRNDFYEILEADWGTPEIVINMAAEAVRHIREMVIRLKAELRRRKRPSPRFSVATLLPTNRDFQRFYIDGVSTLLLTHVTPNLPVDVPFHTIDAELISIFPPDGLHPTPAGYNAMADMMADLIQSRFWRRPAPTPTPLPSSKKVQSDQQWFQ